MTNLVQFPGAAMTCGRGDIVATANMQNVVALVAVTRFVNGTQLTVEYPITVGEVATCGATMEQLVAKTACDANAVIDTAVLIVNSQPQEAFVD